MTEKRAFHRVQFSSKTILSHQDSIHIGRMENISMNGALIRFDHGTFLPTGREYGLTFYIDGEGAPLQLKAEVMCVAFAMVGIKFISYNADTNVRLANLIEELSSDPDLAGAEHERSRRRFANYLREE